MTTQGGDPPGSDSYGGDGKELIGSLLAGRYQITRLLGRGGMGAVYEAVQEPLGRKVALKVIRRSLSDEPSAVKRFTQEAQAVSQLSHPNIVTLFDFGQTDDGQLFLAMELLEGQSLQRALTDDGAMTWERSLHIVSEVCRALVEAHEKGIIHRDLKPDNVMLVPGREERIKVVDFGVAKLIDPGEGRSAMTGTGMVVGTPGYISPEQVNGVSDDPRSDLYALGVMWFEMLTGRAPFEGETPMKVVLRHLNDPAPRPSALATSSVPRDIDALVQRLLGKEPAGRATHAAALLEELQSLSARAAELAEEVITASLSMEEVRAVVERAQSQAPPSAAPPSPPSRPSLPAPLQSATPATGAVVVEPVAAAPAAAASKKRGSASIWLVGCLLIPVALLIGALTLVSVFAIKHGASSAPSFRIDARASASDHDAGQSGGSRINGVPVDEDVVKRAVGKQLGRLIENAVGGQGDAGVADLALKGALEVALESIDKSPDVLMREVALRDLVRDLELELDEDDTTATQRKVLQRIIAKAKALRKSGTPREEMRERVDERASERLEKREERKSNRGRRERREPPEP